MIPSTVPITSGIGVNSRNRTPAGIYGRNVAKNGLSGLNPTRSGYSFAGMLSLDIRMTSNRFCYWESGVFETLVTLHGHPCFGKQVIRAEGLDSGVFERDLWTIGCQ